MDILEEIRLLKQQLYEIEKKVAHGPSQREELPEGVIMLLVARIKDYLCGFLLSSLQEVVPMARLGPLPESPAWVAGMLNLRGQTIPVIDVLARISRTSRKQLPSDFIVVCNTNKKAYGLVVQSVADVWEVSSDEVRPPPEDVPFAPYVLGLVRWKEQPVLLLSVSSLVATSDIMEEQT